ncbi:hypothetical protein F5Y00DRAFT_184367 [Daldinia vernicosa]|uniref:uncharacterized protein n=1 Tax=Daldinia vernicosa TaxID=114800 RepID=UPI002008B5F6|nr:uncharacterized protein F5Y00DRAFT_184367 [Daldinia vernicosa]KAI0844941.1 hypothetical protein F5Y00DRAFT_184367 [Daldinia vernicosa]
MATQNTSIAEGRQEEKINIVCGEPTDGAENGEENRRDSRSFPPEEETWIQKNKKAKRLGEWRQTYHTAYAVRDATHIYKLSRDSPHSAAYASLTDRQERIDFLKRHGIAQRR